MQDGGVLGAITRFQCTNRGGSNVQFWVTVGALAVAAIALYISAREHREFMRQAKARARFRVRLRTLPEAGSDGVVVTTGSFMRPIIEIGIKNVGDRASSVTLINVIGPRGLDGFQWCGPNGETIEESRRPTATTTAGARGEVPRARASAHR